MLGADEALEIGLVDRVVPHEQLDEAIREAIENPPPEGDGSPRDPRFDAIEALFGSTSVEDLRQGKGDPGGDPGLARALKQVGFKAPIALKLAERLIDEGGAVPLADGLKMELSHLIEIFNTADAYEGLSSLGKRRPVFKGE
jgi:enoyl-CoA hydratase/3-hydroxyacyl-CoA dehydrogenase